MGGYLHTQLASPVIKEIFTSEAQMIGAFQSVASKTQATVTTPNRTGYNRSGWRKLMTPWRARRAA